MMDALVVVFYNLVSPVFQQQQPPQQSAQKSAGMVDDTVLRQATTSVTMETQSLWTDAVPLAR